MESKLRLRHTNPALKRQRQVDLCAAKASLVYTEEFQDSQGDGDPISTLLLTHTKQKKKEKERKPRD